MDLFSNYGLRFLFSPTFKPPHPRLSLSVVSSVCVGLALSLSLCDLSGEHDPDWLEQISNMTPYPPCWHQTQHTHTTQLLVSPTLLQSAIDLISPFSLFLSVSQCLSPISLHLISVSFRETFWPGSFCSFSFSQLHWFLKTAIYMFNTKTHNSYSITTLMRNELLEAAVCVLQTQSEHTIKYCFTCKRSPHTR